MGRISRKGSRCVPLGLEQSEFPESVAMQERIFANPSALYHSLSGSDAALGTCQIGSSFAAIASPRVVPPTSPSLQPLSSAEIEAVLEFFSEEKYVLWFNSYSRSACQIHICLKAGHTPQDHLKAWVHAQEVALLLNRRMPQNFEAAMAAVQVANSVVEELFQYFVDKAQESGWKIEESALLSGSPRTISVESVDESVDATAFGEEDRKNI